MSVQSDINLINNYKEDIYHSIKNKGVDIPANTPLSEYSSKVDAISGGGGSGYTYNCFNGNVQTFNDSVSYVNIAFNPEILPNYTQYNGVNQYVLMPLTNEDLGEDDKYKKVKAVIPDANPYLYNGGIQINNGIASGFTSSDLLYITKEIPSEAVYTFKIRQTASTSYSTFFGYAGWLGTYSTYLSIYTDGLHQSSKNLELNKWYFVRVVDDGNSLSMYCLEANDYTYDTLPNISSWECVISDVSRMGVGLHHGSIGYNQGSGDEYWRGEIDLSQSKILINNEVFWEYPQVGIVYTDMYGCINYEDDGTAKSVKAYCVKGQEDKIILGNQPSIVGATVLELGNVNVPAHDLYTYSTTTVPDIILHNTTIEDYIIQGGATGKNAVTPITPSYRNTFELQVGYEPQPTNNAQYATVFGYSGTIDGETPAIGSDSTLWISSNGTNYDIANNRNTGGFTPLKENIIRLCFTGEQYIVKRAIKNSRGYAPLLTANGVVGGSTYACEASHENQPAWYAFDANMYTGDHCWWTYHGECSEQNPCWITYYMPTPTVIKGVYVMNEVLSPASPKNFLIQASNDNTNWDTLYTVTDRTNDAGYWCIYPIQTQTAYQYFRIYCTKSNHNEGVSIQKLNFLSNSFVDDSDPTDADFTTTVTINSTAHTPFKCPLMFLDSGYPDGLRYCGGQLYIKHTWFKADQQYQWQAWSTTGIWTKK